MKLGEAEEYENVEVTYVSGKKAILTIFDDDQEIDRIALSEYKTREELHEMMVKKGFKKKNQEEDQNEDKVKDEL